MACCKDPRIENMSSGGVVNRVCLRCKQHWYGAEGHVREYTGKVWDAYLAGVFDADFPANHPIPYELTEAGREAMK